MFDTGLADRIRAKGVPVVEVAGWQVRGNPSGFAPRGALNHHTAGASVAAVPSLATVIYGRTGLPGPLAQVLQSREPNPADDKAYVIAAGKANHAGVGYWLGLNSNYQLEGLEVEHVGTTTVAPARLETAARIIAAMLEAPGSTADAAYAAQHAEYARPRGRKIDFANLAPWTPDTFRARVAYWIGRTVDTITPHVPQEGTMLVKCYDDSASRWLLVTGSAYSELTKSPKGSVPVVELSKADYDSFRRRLDEAEQLARQSDMRLAALVEIEGREERAAQG